MHSRSLVVVVSFIGDIAKLSHSCSLLPSSWNVTCLWSGSSSIGMLLAGFALNVISGVTWFCVVFLSICSLHDV